MVNSAASASIGANVAIFSVVHAVLLRSLGWGEESRLVSIRGNFPAQVRARPAFWG